MWREHVEGCNMQESLAGTRSAPASPPQRLRGELQALRAASQAQSSASAARPRMLIDDLVPLESFG